MRTAAGTRTLEETDGAAATRRKVVVLSDPISPEGVAVLREAPGLEVRDASGGDREGLVDALSDASALIVRSSTTVDAALLEAAPRLEVVGRAGVGVDNIDLDAATRQGVAVLNAPGGNTSSTAELALALLLAVARRIPEADRAVRAGRWDRKALRGSQLRGRTLGIVGAGRIGSAVAQRARALGMELLVHDPYVSGDRIEDLGAESVELEALFERSDVVTLHAPLTAATEGLVGPDELGLLGPDGYLVNAARGGLVDEEALAAALGGGQLAGAALDVYGQEPLSADSPLREAPNLVMTPHLGAATAEAKREVALEIAGSVRDALLEGDLRRALNAPSIEPTLRPRVEPILELGRRLGTFLADWGGGAVDGVEVRYAGPYEGILRPLAASCLEGFLRGSVDRPLNRVNALHMASERGLEVGRVRLGEAADYANYVELVAEGPEGRHAVGGALLAEGHARIVRVDDFHVDTVPRGTLLVVQNRDVPGVIGDVGTRLGSAGVNIAEYHQARRDEGGDAMAVVTVDGAVPEELLDELRALEHVQDVRQVLLDD